VRLGTIEAGSPRFYGYFLALFFAATFFATGLAAAFSALRFAALGSTAALKAVPGTNFGTFCAAILIFSPACGLKPDIMKMRVIGKGNKARDIPVMGTTLDALEEHYADRMRLIREGKLPAHYAGIAREQTPVLSILREGRKAHVAGPGLTPADAPREPNLTGRLASGSIAIILKEFFGRVALRLDVRALPRPRPFNAK